MLEQSNYNASKTSVTQNDFNQDYSPDSTNQNNSETGEFEQNTYEQKQEVNNDNPDNNNNQDNNVNNNDESNKEITYTGDEKYKSFYDSEEGKNLFQEITNFIKKNNLSESQSKDMIDFINTINEKNNIIDTRTSEDKELWKQEQYKLIGDNAKDVIEQNIKFIKDYNFFSKEQKTELISLMNQGAVGVNLVSSIKDLVAKNIFNGQTEIPTNLHTRTEDLEALEQEFMDCKDAKKSEQLFNKIQKLKNPNFSWGI